MKEPNTLRSIVTLSEMLGPKSDYVPVHIIFEAVVDLLTKTTSPQVFSNLSNKLSMLDVYAPA